MWFTYVYAVKLPSGRLVRAGQDFGPTTDAYKAGDSLGIKNGKEGIVLAVVKGDDAKLNGADVLIIVEERPAKTGGQSVTKTILQLSEELQSPRLTSRPQIQALVGDQRIRAVRNSILFEVRLLCRIIDFIVPSRGVNRRRLDEEISAKTNAVNIRCSVLAIEPIAHALTHLAVGARMTLFSHVRRNRIPASL